MVGRINQQHIKAFSYLLPARLTTLQDYPYIFLVQEQSSRFNEIRGIGSVKGAYIFYDD